MISVAVAESALPTADDLYEMLEDMAAIARRMGRKIVLRFKG